MKRSAILKWSVLAVLLVAGVLYIWRSREEYAALFQVRAMVLPLLFLPPLATFLILGQLNKVLLRAFDLHLKFVEWFGLAVVTSMGNHLLPMRLGATTRAAYLKAQHGFPISAFLSTMGATYLLNTVLAAVIAALCLLAAGSADEPGLRALTLLLAGLSVAFTAVLFVKFPFPSLTNTRLRHVEAVFDAWERLRANRRLLAQASFLLVANFLVIAINLKLCFYALSLECSLLSALTIASLLGFTRLISITPANLGIQEGAIALLSEFLGMGFDEGLVVSVVARVPMTLVTFSLGPVFSVLLAKNVGARSETTVGTTQKGEGGDAAHR